MAGSWKGELGTPLKNEPLPEPKPMVPAIGLRGLIQQRALLAGGDEAGFEETPGHTLDAPWLW
jgi:hypothetical protein